MFTNREILPDSQNIFSIYLTQLHIFVADNSSGDFIKSALDLKRIRAKRTWRGSWGAVARQVRARNEASTPSSHTHVCSDENLHATSCGFARLRVAWRSYRGTTRGVEVPIMAMMMMIMMMVMAKGERGKGVNSWDRGFEFADFSVLVSWPSFEFSVLLYYLFSRYFFESFDFALNPESWFFSSNLVSNLRNLFLAYSIVPIWRLLSNFYFKINFCICLSGKFFFPNFRYLHLL